MYLKELITTNGAQFVTLSSIEGPDAEGNYSVLWKVGSNPINKGEKLFSNQVKYSGFNGRPPKTGEQYHVQLNDKGFPDFKLQPSSPSDPASFETPMSNYEAVKNEKAAKCCLDKKNSEIGFRGILQACIIAYGDKAWDKAEEYDSRVKEKFSPSEA